MLLLLLHYARLWDYLILQSDHLPQIESACFSLLFYRAGFKRFNVESSNFEVEISKI